MLYATTRSKVATYTAQRALKEERSPDGGFYVPTAWPHYDPDALTALLKEPAAEIVARILNDLFKKDLGKLDVEFALGKRFFGMTDISHRIFIGELWRNCDWSFEAACRRLTRRISAEVGNAEPGAWMRIACRIAMIFAFFGELYKNGQLPWLEEADIAVATADFEGPFAAHGARKMGLPVGEVICCCNGNGGLWELLNQGQMKLGAKVQSTMTPKCDRAVPAGLELLIHDRMEWDDVEKFVGLQKTGGTWYLSAEEHRHLRQGISAAVVGDSRIKLAIPNLYKTNGYILCPYSALVYTGLMDYRSRPGKRRAALMLAESDPRQCRETVIHALAISDRELDEWRMGG